ncbi:MAG: DUF2752 domain-containing protein [Candidatus Muiribacteriota bacterium]
MLFIILPVEKFANKHTLCLIKKFTGHNCPGCGTTRAFYSILHFNFLKAYKYNKLSIITFPLAVIVIFKWLKNPPLND